MDLGLIGEVAKSRYICMHPTIFSGFRNLFLANIDNQISSHFNGEKKSGCFIRTSIGSNGKPQMTSDYVGRADRVGYYANLNEEDRIINVMFLSGPMTRNGGECTYGSKYIRDQIIKSADIPQCKGHIIVCDTPGGMASCLSDFRMAFNYARSRGQKVNMLIDGNCYSGGAFTAALCDAVYYINPNDEIGSLRMFSSSFTLKNGAENKITSEVYHEYYASASKDKNAWYRAAAEGDMSVVENDTEAALAELIANIKTDRPSITDDQLTGKEYRVSNVVGTLVDGQKDIMTLATEMLSEYEERNGAPVPAKLGAETASKGDEPEGNGDEPEGSSEQTECKPGKKKSEDADPEDDPNDDDNEGGDDGNGSEDDGDDSEENEDGTKCDPEKKSNGSTSSTTMTQYTAIPRIIGEETMESLDGSLDLTAEQAAELERILSEKDTRVENLQQQLAAERKAHADEVATLNASHEEQLNATRAAHNKTCDDLNSVHEQKISELNAQIQQLTKQRDDLQATVAELNSNAGGEPKSGEQPSSNGQQAPRAPRIVTSSCYNPKLSAEENFRNFEAAQKKLAASRR